MATIKDVARMAGVSTATVSHVLNNTRYVSEETRSLVLEAVSRLGYRPSGVARSLTTKQTHLVGLLISDVTNPFFSELVRGTERRLAAHGYHVIVCNTDEQPDREADYLEFLYSRRVDGLVVASTGADQALYEVFRQQGVPMVFVDRRPPAPVGPFVGVDNEAIAYRATRYLLDMGHRRIGFLGRNVQLSTVLGRMAGYERALAEDGLPLNDELCRQADHSLAGARQCAEALVAAQPPPTAILTANHIMALAVLQVLASKRIRCPQDMSLVCFDDHAWAPLFTPPLTVVRMPIDAFCDYTVDTLLAGLRLSADGRQATELADQVLEAELVIRASACAPSCAGDMVGRG